MNDMYIFNVVFDQNRWLSVRQTAVAQNVANANTPGYQHVDVAAFEESLSDAKLDLRRSSPSHMSDNLEIRTAVAVQDGEADEVQHSGNTVSIESEFAKASEIARSFSLNASVLKSFNRMLLLSSKG